MLYYNLKLSTIYFFFTFGQLQCDSFFQQRSFLRQLGTFAWTDQKGKTRRCYHERKPNKPTNTGNVIESSAFSSGIATVENLTKEEAFDDWRVKISYPYADSTSWHLHHEVT